MLALAVAGCSPSTAPVASPTPTASVAPTAPSAGPAPSTTPAAAVNPFTGEGRADQQVLVVKIDNTTGAQPHAGLRHADIVYVEEVEWGLTRLAAVFSGNLPKVVGPIRSARISDIDLLAQFGKPAFAFSGSQKKMHPIIAAAPLYAVSPDYGDAGFYREADRRAPYNEMANPAVLLAQAPKASRARDIGFRFSATAPAGGTPVKSVTATYPDSQAKYVWDAATGTFDVWLNKRPAREAEGGTQHAATVVIQYVKQTDSGFGDKYGGHTPLLHTVGTGTGLVLRDGMAYPVTWSRPVDTGGTTFRLADGSVMTFKPGQVWVTLVKKGRKVTTT